MWYKFRLDYAHVLFLKDVAVLVAGAARFVAIALAYHIFVCARHLASDPRARACPVLSVALAAAPFHIVLEWCENGVRMVLEWW
jgi:hypothetical protein